ncbi:hypothetical protein [Nocardia sp. NPDC005366]|uniref:hypothetical protein n=1 Tax=Nocardia sp. NPDC005366 TaxID=3156878 RepID=UPI00339EC8E1
MVRRFWIEFDLSEYDPYNRPAMLVPGVGVTGFDERDCLTMVADLHGGALPPVLRITPDISLADWRGPIGVPVWRGVWYPPSNLRTGPNWRPRGVVPRAEPAEPVTVSRPRQRASEVLRTRAVWVDDIPHIDNLRWEMVHLHHPTWSDPAWLWRRQVQLQRDNIVKSSAFGDMFREALDYMIARHPTPTEWFDLTRACFLDQQELDEYLRAYREYLFGNRSEPIPPPSDQRRRPGAGTASPDS